MNIVVLSSVYGKYDTVKDQPKQTVDCRFVMVTDDLPDSKTWDIIHEPRSHQHPRMAAKHPKCLPWEYVPDADVVIWIDGSSNIVRSDFVEMCLDFCPWQCSAMWRHPSRNCIYDETAVSIAYEKYDGQNLQPQADHYRASGHAVQSGLWATGCIVRKRADFHAEIGRRWLAEQIRWTYQDQISLPVVLAEVGHMPAALPEMLWANKWLVFGQHSL